uniref:Uncharacterized protein LOC110193628 n=1 Tax=Phascolarctos cinereus TaxID=38626 RepID=A0A6P5IG43_PHACI|nr:uncharacterized protein LOC110193628 [Phascolarctos cinereus]
MTNWLSGIRKIAYWQSAAVRGPPGVEGLVSQPARGRTQGGAFPEGRWVGSRGGAGPVGQAPTAARSARVPQPGENGAVPRLGRRTGRAVGTGPGPRPPSALPPPSPPETGGVAGVAAGVMSQKKPDLELEPPAESAPRCSVHAQELKWFCSAERRLVCAGCKGSGGPCREHHVRRAEERAEELRGLRVRMQKTTSFCNNSQAVTFPKSTSRSKPEMSVKMKKLRFREVNLKST